MSLIDAARAARTAADASTDPGDHMLALALAGAVDAAAREQLSQLQDEPDLEGLPPPEEEGHPSSVWILRSEN